MKIVHNKRRVVKPKINTLDDYLQVYPDTVINYRSMNAITRNTFWRNIYEDGTDNQVISDLMHYLLISI